ncbi:Growth arrest-specific protein 2 [Eumeta japonica]|uniref:Growth arrest-specific protein 2 n=1 Tax=Eumeta variegata TaxID=151549 RepID=A0A4C1WF82_EUMVA|nr:Growth arrest-specific protein 2 [Eumeta japonica]
MDTRNPRGVTDTLPASWEEIRGNRISNERGWKGEKEGGPSELLLTGRKATAEVATLRPYCVRVLYFFGQDCPFFCWSQAGHSVSYLTGENFLDMLDNGVALCQLATVIHDRAREAVDQGLIIGPSRTPAQAVPTIRGRCWQRAARRSFFSRDNAENFITFCRELGVHENLLFESDDLVLHNQPRQVILCLLEVARLATRAGIEPPGLVQLEREIALEERDSGLDSAMSGTAWQFRDASPTPGENRSSMEPPPSPDINDSQLSVPDHTDAESTKSEGTVDSNDSDVPLKPTNELDKRASLEELLLFSFTRVQLVTRLLERGCRCGAGRCSKLLKVKKVGEGRYNIAGRNVFIRLLKGRHMMVRVGGGWDTLEHFLSRHEPCQVRLVTQGRRASLLPVPLVEPQPELTAPLSRSSSKASSLGKEPSSGTASSLNSKASSISGKISPTDHKTGKISPTNSNTGKLTPVDNASGKTSPASIKSGKRSSIDSKSGKTSPVENKNGKNSKTSSGKSSPLHEPPARRTSTPKPITRSMRSSLTLPLNGLNTVDGRVAGTAAPRPRKQSAPASYSTPNTPTGRPARTPGQDAKKGPVLQKKTRSMSLASVPAGEKKAFCGTERLNAYAKRNGSVSAATTPTGETASRKTRSHSLASTPVAEPKKLLGNGKLNPSHKTRSMSLTASTPVRVLNKSVSTNGGITQAAIEASIRLSLEASLAETPDKPFLHIKAKYRSPPPREVPPR